MSIYRAFMQCFKWPGRLGTRNVFLKSKNKLKFICKFFLVLSGREGLEPGMFF